MFMLIRIAVAISDIAQEEQLALKLTGVSIVLDVAFDIALYSNHFDKLVNNIHKIDVAIIDFDTLQQNMDKVSDLYLRNTNCLPILLGEESRVGDFLQIRPIGHIGSIMSIDPENENEQIRKTCEFFLRTKDAGFREKTDNSVLYITTRQESYAIPKDSILYCQSDLKYTFFVTEDGTIIRKLEKLQDVAEKYLWDFVRVHQSYLVNPRRVKFLDKAASEVVLSNNTHIPISRKYAADARELFNY